MSAGWDSSSPQGPSESEYAGQMLAHARGRADVAGLILLVTGVISLIMPGHFTYSAIQLSMITEQQYHAQLEETIQQLKQFFPNDLPGPLPAKQHVLMYTAGVAAVMFVGSMLMILAGLRMRQLRSYGLAITGSLVAMIPCLSCVGTCGIGQVAGIWALVVLFNPYVRMAFGPPIPQQGGNL